MHTVPVLPAFVNDFEQKEAPSESGTPEMPDIGESDSGELQLHPPDKVEIELVSWQQFSLLLRTGGWTVAVLLTFRFVLVPLLAAGNTPVALTLAIGVSIFLVLCAIGALVKELKR